MKTLELTDATAPLADYAREIEQEPIVLIINGKPIAILLSLEDMDLETVTLSSNPQFLALIERSRKRQNVEGGLSSDELRRRLGLAH